MDPDEMKDLATEVITLDADSWKALLKMLREPTEPTQALIDLMRSDAS